MVLYYVWWRKRHCIQIVSKLWLILNQDFLKFKMLQLVLLKYFYAWAKCSLDSITGTMKQVDTLLWSGDDFLLLKKY